MQTKATHRLPFFSTMLALAALVVASSSHAFVFADGKTMRCEANGGTVEETEADTAQGPVPFTGTTVRTPSGFKIIWNSAKLKALPPDVHDYIFFHECAHAHVPTIDEIQANCVGLKDMRAAGRAGPAVESRLSAFYGAGSGFWASTLSCANAGAIAKP